MAKKKRDALNEKLKQQAMGKTDNQMQKTTGMMRQKAAYNLSRQAQFGANKLLQADANRVKGALTGGYTPSAETQARQMNAMRQMMGVENSRKDSNTLREAQNGLSDVSYLRAIRKMAGLPETQEGGAQAGGTANVPVENAQPGDLYNVTENYWANGGVKPPQSYEQIVADYYANAPEEVQTTQAGIAQQGGWRSMTPEQVQQMTSPSVYRPADDVGPLDWSFNQDVRAASRMSYVNQRTDMQTAMANGVFDQPQYLLGGDIQYVSTDYLTNVRDALPAMIEQEHQDYFSGKEAYEAETERLLGLDSVFSAATGNYEANMPLMDVTGMAQSAKSQMDYMVLPKAMLQAAGSEETFEKMLTAVIDLDNAVNGTSVTLDEIYAMEPAQQGAEIARMVNQYDHYIFQGESYVDEREPYRQMYPYEAVQEMVEAELESREVMTPMLSTMMADPNVYEMSEFDPVKAMTPGYGSAYQQYIYKRANSMEVEGTGMIGEYGDVPFDMMTDMERAVFNYYYNTGDIDTAFTFLDEMKGTLMRRGRAIDQVGWEIWATDNVFSGALAWAGAGGANLMAAIQYPYDLLMAATENDNGMPNAFSDYARTVTGAQHTALGELGGPQFMGQNIPQWLYGAGSSMRDMGIAYATGGLLGGGNIPLYIMATEAAASDLADTAGSDMRGWERALHSAGTGAIELATERLPFEAFTSDPNMPGYWLRNVASEAVEEGVSETAGYALDEVAAMIGQRKSPMQQRIDFLKLNGVENADAVVLGEMAQGVASSAISGGLAGGGMGASTVIPNAANNYNIGKKINTAGNAQTLIGLGVEMGNTEAGMAARELAASTEDGKKVSASKLGRLYRIMMTETAKGHQDNIHQIAIDGVADITRERSDQDGTGLGGYTPVQIAEAIVGAAEKGGEITGKIGEFIRTNDLTARIYEEFTEGASGWTKKIRYKQGNERMQNALQTARIIATTRGEEAMATEAAPTNQSVSEETQEGVERLTRRKNPSEKLSRVITMKDENGTEVTGEFRRVERTRDGIFVVAARDGEDVSIPLDQVAQVSGAGLARILDYASRRAEIGAQEINAMASALYETGEGVISSGQLIAAFEGAVNAGFVGMDMPSAETAVKRAGEKAAKALDAIARMGYEMGRKEAQNAESLRRATIGTANRGTGKVSYMGEVENAADVVDTGMRRSVKSLGDSLSVQQHAAIDTIRMIAAPMGVDVVFYRTKAESGEELITPNGFYAAGSNTIFLDLNSGMNAGGENLVNYAIMRTFSHELTHFIEKNSNEGYRQLREMVKDLLSKKGESYADLLTVKIREYENVKTRADAEAELIADACEMMLKDTRAIRTLAEKNLTLAGRIRSFIATFVRRIKAAFTGITPDTQEATKLMELRDGAFRYVDGLQETWDKALIEAAGADRKTPDRWKRVSITKSATIAREAEESAAMASDDVHSMAKDMAETAVRVILENGELVNEAAGAAPDEKTDSDVAEAADELMRRTREATREAADEMYVGEDAEVAAMLERVADAVAENAVEARLNDAAVEAAKKSERYPRRRSDYQYPFASYRNAFRTDEYHAFANAINQKIRAYPNEKEFVIPVEVQSDSSKLVFVEKIGSETYDITGIYKMNRDLYNGDTKTLIKALEAFIDEYGHTRFARWSQSSSFNGLKAFFSRYDRQSGSFPRFRKLRSRALEDAKGTIELLARDRDGRRIPEENGNVEYSQRRMKPNLTVREAMMAITDTTGMTPAEASMLTRYQANVLKMGEVEEAIAEQKEIADDTGAPADVRAKAKQEMYRLRRQRYAIEKEIIDAENDGGYAKLMTTAGEMVRLLSTRDTLPEATEELRRRIADVNDQLTQLQAQMGQQAEADTWNTIGSLFDRKKLREAVRKIKAMYGSRISEERLMNRIILMQTTLLKGGKNSSEDYIALGEELVRELRRKMKTDSEILSVFKEQIGSIALTETQRQEIRNTVGMKEFIRTVNPVVKILPKGQGSVTLDVLLNDMRSETGGANPLLPYFDGHMNEGDSIMRLYDLISRERNNDPYAGRYGQEVLQEEMVEVMSIAAEATLLDAGAETVKSVMDAMVRNAKKSEVVTEKLEKLKADLQKAKGEAATAAFRAERRHDAFDDVIKYLTNIEQQNMLLERQDALRTIERQVNERSEGRIREIISERNQLERNRVMRERIKRTVGWMDKRIRKETDRKNIPEELKPYIEDAIRIFIDNNDVLRVFKKTEVADVKRVYDALKEIDVRRNGQLNDLLANELDDAFKSLRVQLGEYAAAKKEHDRKKKAHYRSESLKAIDEITTMLWGKINTWNDIFIGGKEAQLSEVAAQTVDGLRKQEDYSIANHMGGKLWEQIKNAARNGNLTPQYFFRLLKGNDVMQTLNEDIVSAQNEYGLLYSKAKKSVEEIQKEYNYWQWKNADTLKFTTEQGERTKDKKHDIELTVDEAMSIWAIWKRELETTPLFESTHMSNGGIVLATGKRIVDGRVVQDSTPHKITMADIAVIDQYLTKEMKAYAEAIVGYMSKDMAEVGNRASMRLYGIRKFKEKFYFPMSVQRDQLAQSSNKAAKNPDANRIAGMSSAHRRVEKAWKPLAIGSFTEVAANHINDMLLYGTFAVPIENFNTILNYNYVYDTAPSARGNMAVDESSMTIRALFKQKYGKDMTKYLEQYIADLNGGTGIKETSKLASLYKRSAVMASVSVMLQQPLSVIRAWMVQNPRYYLPIVNGTARAPRHGEWEQLMNYSGVAVIKDIGGFDMTSSRSMASGLVGTPEDAYSAMQKAGALIGINVKGERWSGAKRTANEALSLGAQMADRMTWIYMWRAAKAEVAALHSGMDKNSEEFLKLAAKRFEEVVNLTQVYDSTIVRSQNMRSKSQWMQMATAFMAEPTLTWNMLMDAAASRDPGTIARAAGIFLLSNVVTAAVKSLWTAGRDEDKEKPWAEKYLAAMGGELGGIGGSMNVFNLLPWARDVMSLLEGYDVERADMSLISTMIEEGKKLLSGKYDSDPMKGVRNVAFAAANLLGIPAKNIWRDVSTGYNNVRSLLDPGRGVNTLALQHDWSYNALTAPDRTNAWYNEAIYEAMESGNKERVDAYYEYMGIRGKTADSVNTGVRKVVQTRFMEGDITEEEAKEIMITYGLAEDEKDAFRYVDKWREDPAHRDENGNLEEGYSYNVYDTIREAVAEGDEDAVEAAKTELIENGWEEDDVLSQVRSAVDDAYMTGSMSKEKAISISQRDDWDDNKWYWHFKELDYAKENGGSKDGWGKFNAYYEAVESGKDLKAVTQDYLTHGVEKGTLKTRIREQYRDKYRELYRTNRREYANLRARLVKALEVAGYTRESAIKYLDGWLED